MEKNLKLSVALATFNEEDNLRDCLLSVSRIADEIVVVDGSSVDKTVQIAKDFKTRLIITNNPPIFHINKQKALEACRGEWILQLDADERVSSKLANEIKKIIEMNDQQINQYQNTLTKRQLFLRHQKLLTERDGRIGTDSGKYVGFFVPRLNYFLGKYLKYGGVYPDGVIRLVKSGKAYFPAKNVHEQIVVNGRVGWLQNDLIHLADTTFTKYLKRNNKYIGLLSMELEEKNVQKSLVQFFNYFLIKPLSWFLLTVVRHKGFLDGIQGVIFAFFSALRFPRAYWRYFKK